MLEPIADRRGHPPDPGGAPYTEYDRRAGRGLDCGPDRGKDRRENVRLAKELSVLPCVDCKPMRAKLTHRACLINQLAASMLAERLKAGGDASRMMGHGSRVWALLVACGGCERCEEVGQEDVDRGRLAVQGLWKRFSALPLHFTDPEYRRLVVIKNREKRRYARRKERG